VRLERSKNEHMETAEYHNEATFCVFELAEAVRWIGLSFCSAELPPGLRKICGTFVTSSNSRGSPHKPRGSALQSSPAMLGSFSTLSGSFRLLSPL